MKPIAALLASAFVVFLAGAASTQEATNLRQWDADMNGALSLSEIDAALVNAFERFDVNEDGDLKAGELDALNARIALVALENNEDPLRLASPDTNTDLIVSRGEFLTWSRTAFGRAVADGRLAEFYALKAGF